MRSLAAIIGLLCLISGCANAHQEDSRSSTTRLIAVDAGVSLAITDWGGAGPPLLFVPSWSGTEHLFDDFAPRFTDAYRVIVMNKRGHGASSRPDHGYTIDRLTQDMLVVLDSLGIERATVFALSRSASLVTQFAARYPERVDKLVYLSGPIDRAHAQATPKADLRRRLGDLIESLGTDCPGASITYPVGSFDDTADTLGVAWRQQDPPPPYEGVRAPALAFWAGADIGESLTSRCGRTPGAGWSVEVLERYRPLWEVMDGERSHDIELFQRELGGRVVEIPGADYYTYMTHPQLVEREVRSFLERGGAE
jgi:pimeloyl-ACP methyl ester carboxylesterase